MVPFLIPLLLIISLSCPFNVIASSLPESIPVLTSTPLQQAKANLHIKLKKQNITTGSFVFIRIFKAEKQLEIWLQRDNSYTLFNTYPICSYSGYLGPKRKQGDLQSPEGFYQTSPAQLLKESAYHLAFDIGYPNLYDRLRRSSGSNIMVHGDCSSSGCYAMGDVAIEEIFLLLQEAFRRGQQVVHLHIFPFVLTSDTLQSFSTSPWFPFWQELQPGYTYFEKNRRVPNIMVENGQYIISQK